MVSTPRTKSLPQQWQSPEQLERRFLCPRRGRTDGCRCLSRWTALQHPGIQLGPLPIEQVLPPETSDRDARGSRGDRPRPRADDSVRSTSEDLAANGPSSAHARPLFGVLVCNRRSINIVASINPMSTLGRMLIGVVQLEIGIEDTTRNIIKEKHIQYPPLHWLRKAVPPGHRIMHSGVPSWSSDPVLKKIQSLPSSSSLNWVLFKLMGRLGQCHVTLPPYGVYFFGIFV